MPTPAPTRTGWAAPRGPFPQPQASPRPDGLAAVYRRRDPTATPPYPLVQYHLETFLADAAAADPDGEAVPQWVEDDFRAYLRCGILAHGFARIRCDTCVCRAPRRLLLQGPRRLPFLQRPPHGGGGRPPHRSGAAAAAAPSVGALPAEADPPLPAPRPAPGRRRAARPAPRHPHHAAPRQPIRDRLRPARCCLLPAPLRLRPQSPLPLPCRRPRRRLLRGRRWQRHLPRGYASLYRRRPPTRAHAAAPRVPPLAAPRAARRAHRRGHAHLAGQPRLQPGRLRAHPRLRCRGPRATAALWRPAAVRS
jgi:hypothetical protein